MSDLDQFIRAAQYLTAMNAQQDGWAELTQVMTTFLTADVAAVAEKPEERAPVIHHWTGVTPPGLREAVKAQFADRILDAIETGVLDAFVLDEPTPHAFAILPLELVDHPPVALLVGDARGEPLPRHRLDSLLAMARLAATTLSKLRSEAELREHHAQLEAQVRERTRSLRQEVAERRRAEQALLREHERAEAANHAKSAFLANMSHEIRTPLTAIVGFTSLMLDEMAECESCTSCDHCARKPVIEERLQTIDRNSNHLLALINDILDLSKIEAGKLEVESIRCSPLELLAEIDSLMNARAVDKGLRLSFEFAGPLPETIQSDPTRIRQILVNLVGNAIKFTSAGSIRVVTRMLEAESDDPTLCFDVIDSGIGMTSAQADRLFQPFAQGDSSMTRKHGGTGLGLNISRRLARMLGGDVDLAATAEGRGTEMRLTIRTGSLKEVPLIHAPSLTRGPTFPADDEADRTGPLRIDARILLAEDGEDNQEFIATLLRRAGARVEIVTNGREAIQRALTPDGQLAENTDTSPYDLVLMDMQMPVMDGYQATRLLRRRGFDTPIIALTAHAMAADRQKCFEVGCTDFATKPIDRSAFFETLRCHLPPGRVTDADPGSPSGSACSRRNTVGHDSAPTETKPAAEEAPPADPLVSRLAEDPLLGEVVKRFAGRIHARINELAEAHARNDRETLALLAHKLKGASGSYGFDLISEIAGQIERQIEEDNDLPQAIQPHIDRLIDLCTHA